MAALPEVRVGEIVHNRRPAYVNYNKEFNDNAEKAYRLWKASSAVCDIGKLCSSNPGTYQRVGEHLDIAQTLLSITRSITMLVKIASGEIIWKYEKRPVTEEDANGKPRHKTTIDREGKISYHYEMVRVQQGARDILCNVCLAVARILNPLLWLHKMGIIDLGKHAKGIGLTVGVCFTAVTSCVLIDASISLADEYNKEVTDREAYKTSLGKKIAEFISSVVDFFSIPSDCDWSFTGIPELALASACCKLASGVIWTVTYLVYD